MSFLTVLTARALKRAATASLGLALVGTAAFAAMQTVARRAAAPGIAHIHSATRASLRRSQAFPPIRLASTPTRAARPRT